MITPNIFYSTGLQILFLVSVNCFKYGNEMEIIIKLVESENEPLISIGFFCEKKGLLRVYLKHSWEK